MILWAEPVFFLAFGLFHLHRLWGLADRTGYAAFWLGLLQNRGPAYFCLLAALALLCGAGLAVFFRKGARGAWWRWAYLAGGGYVLFDLAAIASGWAPWRALLAWMFQVDNPFWNWIWGGFSLLGLLSLLLGLYLICKKWKSWK